MYYPRLIDESLREWAQSDTHKPVLLRGARQVGKSTAVRHLGESFANYVEINFEKSPEYKSVFASDLDVRRIVSQISALSGRPIEAGSTLLFLDEIQSCPEAIMALRFFREDMPALHVIAAGSLLEFALDELPTFGVGRIHSMFMYPMSFDEFLRANGADLLLRARNAATSENPLPEVIHERLVELFRNYILVGGMPEVVACWVATHDYLKCNEIQDDIAAGYEDDFPKYRKKVDPALLRLTLRSVAVQASRKFLYSEVAGYRGDEVKKAVNLLLLAGIIVAVTRTDANGLPLGGEADHSFRKLMPFDTGLMLRLLNMSLGSVAQITADILTAKEADFVNKGSITEVIAGLEMLRYKSANIRHELFFWTRNAKNSQAEIDYVTVASMNVLPIEVKAGTQGGMKSLWMFMREKKLSLACRSSLENFGTIRYTDTETGDERTVRICPLYAISMMERMFEKKTEQ